MSGQVGRPRIDRDAFLRTITRNVGRSGTLYVSPIRLETELGISTRSIRRMLRELEEQGKLQLIRREGTRALVYRVL